MLAITASGFDQTTRATSPKSPGRKFSGLVGRKLPSNRLGAIGGAFDSSPMQQLRTQASQQSGRSLDLHFCSSVGDPDIEKVVDDPPPICVPGKMITFAKPDDFERFVVVRMVHLGVRAATNDARLRRQIARCLVIIGLGARPIFLGVGFLSEAPAPHVGGVARLTASAPGLQRRAASTGADREATHDATRALDRSAGRRFGFAACASMYAFTFSTRRRPGMRPSRRSLTKLGSPTACTPKLVGVIPERVMKASMVFRNAAAVSMAD